MVNALTNVVLAVEGDLDEAVASRLLAEYGAAASRVYGKRGRDYLERQAPGYNRAAQHERWLLLADLDRDPCPDELRQRWIREDRSPQLCFRFAVREIESWLLADKASIGAFLHVAARHLPPIPDDLPDPKRTLIEVSANSSRREIRDGIVPKPNARVGPLYTSLLTEFVRGRWNVPRAAISSPSLARCVRRISELVAQG